MNDISIISIGLTVILVLVCLFLILGPYFKGGSYLNNVSKGQNAASIKEGLLTTLNEIEFEYKMDKISENDYKSLKKQYEQQVAKLIKDEEQDEHQKIDQALLAELELEIQKSMKNYQKKKGEGK